MQLSREIRATDSVSRVEIVIEATTVVEEGEKANNSRIRFVVPSDEQPIPLNAHPVGQPVNTIHSGRKSLGGAMDQSGRNDRISELHHVFPGNGNEQARPLQAGKDSVIGTGRLDEPVPIHYLVTVEYSSVPARKKWTGIPPLECRSESALELMTMTKAAELRGFLEKMTLSQLSISALK